MELAAGTSNASHSWALFDGCVFYPVPSLPQTLFTVCEMGLFDLLASSWCPLSLEEVVQVIRASLSGTEKLYLTRSIHYSSKTIYLCWHYLIDACIGYHDNTITWFTLSGTQAVYSCDYNTLILYYTSLHLSLSLGCCGALAKKYVLTYPECTVTIFDIQRTLCYCRQPDDQLPLMDFFKDELLDADLYILARILHGWTDTRSIELLRSLQGLQTKYTHPPPSPLSPSVILSGEKDQMRLDSPYSSLNLLLETNSKQQSGYDNCHD
uniref:O-methyltransferase domain-containing protein n=1 Tax=Salmo trutta TaxID=8032 RepID=A0A673XSQ7_SALTR